MSNQNFIEQLAKSQQNADHTRLQQEQARLDAREEAFATLDPNGDEIGFPGHVATFVFGLTTLGIGIGFFSAQVTKSSATGKKGASALDDPVVLVPLIASVVGLFMILASSLWLFNDYKNKRCTCGGSTKVIPGMDADLEAQNEIRSPEEAMLFAQKAAREQQRQDREERKKSLPKTILFANDRVLLLLELFEYYTRAMDVPEIGCNGLSELMVDCMTGKDEEASLQEARNFMNQIDLGKRKKRKLKYDKYFFLPVSFNLYFFIKTIY